MTTSIATTFVNLVRGNRLSAYVGLQMTEEIPFKYGADYTYVEIPIQHLFLLSEEKVVTEAKKQQRIAIVPACSVEPRGTGTHLYIEPNRELALYGDISPSYYLHTGDGRVVPTIYMSLRKDVSLADVKYAIRIYMVN